MRVLSVLHYNGFGGPHNSNMRVIPLLGAYGIHTTVLLPDEPGDAAQRLAAAGIETLQIPLGRPRLTFNPVVHAKYLFALSREVAAIRKVIRERAIDLVLINGFGNVQGGIAARLEGKAVVCQIFDVGHPMPYRIAMMPVMKRIADVLMSTGMSVARAHPGATSFGDRLLPFYMPVDTEQFKPDPRVRTAARAELGLAPEEVIVGNVSNLNYQKNHPAFVRAAAELRKIFPAVRFVILGATLANRRQNAATLARLAEGLGLRVGRDLILRDPGLRVASLAQAFDIFWMTSRWEGTPTVLEEAMALKIPIVSTDVGAVSETIEDGVSGFLVPAGDSGALVRSTIPLVDNPQLRTAMGEKGRQRALERFRVSLCADIHARAFFAAIEHNSRRGVERIAQAS
jgi:glycosyltransferase involved in cell wall biosynthesis